MTVSLPVHVVPGASSESVVGWHGDRLKLRVTAPPDRGKANRAVLRLLARTLDLPVSALEMSRGHTHSDKMIEISGSDESAVYARLPRKK